MAGRKPTDIVPLTLRLREELRRKLERDAKSRNDSINNVVIERLEASFAEGTHAALVTALTGEGDNALLLRLIARALVLHSHSEGTLQNSTQVVRDAIGFIVDAVAGSPFKGAESTAGMTAREKLEKLLLAEDEDAARLLASLVLNAAALPSPIDPATIDEWRSTMKTSTKGGKS